MRVSEWVNLCWADAMCRLRWNNGIHRKHDNPLGLRVYHQVNEHVNEWHPHYATAKGFAQWDYARREWAVMSGRPMALSHHRFFVDAKEVLDE